MDRVLFSDNTVEWGTDWALFELVDSVWHFGIDVCASEHNFKVERYYSKRDNGLRKSWFTLRGPWWGNFPYGRKGNVTAWVKKAEQEREIGAAGCALLPNRSSEGWWQDWVEPFASEIVHVPYRLRHQPDKNYRGPRATAAFSSVLLSYYPDGHPGGLLERVAQKLGVRTWRGI